MRVNQQCASCQSVYSLGAQQFASLRLAWCPSCGHPNAKRPVTTKKATQKAKAVQDGAGLTTTTITASSANTRLRSGYQGLECKSKLPLEKFRKQIEEKAKVFIVGDGDIVNQVDMSMIREAETPTIGVGAAWEKFPHLDAMVLSGDHEGTSEKLMKLEKWTDWQKGRFLFWRRKMGGYTWLSKSGVHGLSQDDEGKKVCDLKLNFRYANVQYFHHEEGFVSDLQIPLSLMSGEVESAINLAWLFGAREIILLGVKYPPEIEIPDCNLIDCDPDTSNYRQFEMAVNMETPVYIARLMKKIAMTGKCFVLGTAPSLDEMPLQRLFGFPIIGTNAAFQKFPFLDALCFGDKYFAEKWAERLKIWQFLREEKPILFWQNYGGGSELQRVFSYVKGQPSTCIKENIPGRENPCFSLKHSIITAAINCAYWLGAKEIYLLGVEFGPGHFYDPDGQIYKDLGKVSDRFPHVEKIVPFIKTQVEYLRKRGVSLSTCWGGDCAIKDIVPYVPIEEAADGRYLTQLFGDK